MKRALLLYGGWKGHDPEGVADFAEQTVLRDFEVVRSRNVSVINDRALAKFDFLVPVWTFGRLTLAQERALLRAVQNGLGLLAWHGAASSFLNSRRHKFVLGGQFVGHPDGNEVTYKVRFCKGDPLVAGLRDFSVVSERYYLLIDPAVHVLANTRVASAELPWLTGVDMPIAWTRRWGKGRVFYCALGHTPQVLGMPAVRTLLTRAAAWVSRR